jgi:hypothetical protein
MRAITKNQRSLEMAVVMSALMPFEKYSCPDRRSRWRTAARATAEC